VIVFVTAYERHAVTAYGIGAVDYLLKPVRAERLAAALVKVSRMVSAREQAGPQRRPLPDAMAALPVESAGRTRYVRRGVRRAARRYRAAAHPVRRASGADAVRLQEYWEALGFARARALAARGAGPDSVCRSCIPKTLNARSGSTRPSEAGACSRWC
jgi:hypothetical protein